MAGFDIVRTEDFPALRAIVPRRHQDQRGFFSEVWREDAFRHAGVEIRFVQENHALSHAPGTIRGLHFQIGENAQAKLIRCLHGSIFDVAVDIRRGSPTFGRYAAIVLSARNWKQFFVPVGFAHGYCSLEADTEVLYKVSAYYDPASERGLAWNDPTVAISWPVGQEEMILSDKDRSYPELADVSSFFPYPSFPD
jgi:dTDP-4-dehydrorhamnose 3,5-epimerase